MTPQQIGNDALSIYQANRGERAICEALLDEFFCGAEYTATMDAVRSAMSEEPMPEIDIGHLSSGIRANAADLCDSFWKNPARRVEFGEQEIRDIREAVLGLWTILREIEKAEAA